jgi:tRNA pseudouridine38-40 synthase
VRAGRPYNGRRGGPVRNLKLTLAYVGTRFAGWQVQPGLDTVQGILEARLGAMLRERVRLLGAGRTDAGVHARGQVASFTTASRIPPEGLRRGLNARLPDDIRVLAVEEAPAGFHAREHALSKEYHYRIVRGEVVSPFETPFALWVYRSLDVAAMQAAAAGLRGRHDFTSFCAAGSTVRSRVRTVFESEVAEEGTFVVYRVRADGFLQHMVRTIAGTLLLAGSRRLDPGAIPAVLGAMDRRRAGPCAPPRGLFLVKVHYGEAT